MHAAEFSSRSIWDTRYRLTLRRDLVFHGRDGGRVVLEDPASGRHYRLGTAEYRFIVLLDNAESINGAWRRQESAQPTLTRSQAERLCCWLVANRLVNEAGSAAAGAVRPRGQLQQMNPLFFRVSLFHPDKFFARLSQLTRPLFTRTGITTVAVLMLWAALTLAARWTEFLSAYSGLLVPGRAVGLFVSWCGLKVCHELGHGVVCKRCGGRVPDAGLAFRLFAPIAYIDVTSSCRFASRWQRIQVALAGVAVELIAAAIAILVWSHSQSPTVQRIAADVTLAASIGTLAFNLNPLMRFDGYFVLVDLLRADNLYILGQAHVQYILKRYVLRFPAQRPPLPKGIATFVKAYGFTTAVWRLMVIVGLLVAAAAMFRGAGIVLAALAAFTWFVLPAARFVRQRIVERPMPCSSFLAVIGRLGLVSVGFFAVLCIVPATWSRTAPAVAEYNPPTVVRCLTAGFVDVIHVRANQTVQAGELLMKLSNPDLELELSAAETALTLAQQRARAGAWRSDAAQTEDARAEVVGLEKRVGELRRRVAELSVRAPIAGTVVARRLDELAGTYLHEGREIASIGSEESKRLKISLDQNSHHELSIGSPVCFWAPGMSEQWATLSCIEPRANRRLPDQSLGAPTGGQLAVARADSPEPLLCQSRFNAYADLDQQTSQKLRTGQRCHVALGTSYRSIGGILLDRLVAWTSW